MRTSLPLGRIFGVEVHVHYSTVIIIALFTWVLGYQSLPVAGLPVGFGKLGVAPAVRLVLALAVAVLFLGSVLIHELAHSWVALRMGIRVSGITLFIFGGVSQMEDMPKDPRQELKMAFAGPATSLVIGLGMLLGYWGVLLLPSSLAIEAVAIALGTLAFYNLVLGVFNLVPAFPTDGGRMLRAALAMGGNYRKATKTAADVGKAIAIAMAVLGLLTLNLWLVLIAAFIYIGGSQEEQGTRISLALEHHHVSELMVTIVDSVPPTMTMGELYAFMWQHQHLGYPVVEDGKLVGLITFEAFRGLPQERLGTARVGELMLKDVLTAAPADDAMDAFKRLVRGPGDRLVVMDAGKVIGIVTQADFLRAVKLAGG